MGHVVEEETVLDRYNSSVSLILDKAYTFNEVHFYDVSEIIPVKSFDIFDGELNYINEEREFAWSNEMIDYFLNALKK